METLRERAQRGSVGGTARLAGLGQPADVSPGACHNHAAHGSQGGVSTLNTLQNSSATSSRCWAKAEPSPWPAGRPSHGTAPLPPDLATLACPFSKHALPRLTLLAPAQPATPFRADRPRRPLSVSSPGHSAPRLTSLQSSVRRLLPGPRRRAASVQSPRPPRTCPRAWHTAGAQRGSGGR